MLGPMTYGALAAPAGGWTPASATTDGGRLPHTWHYAGATLYQDSAETTPIVSSGDPVGSSVNQGTDGHSAVQVTSNIRPTWHDGVLNGHPVFRFSGSSQYLVGSYVETLSQPFVVFAVAKLDTAKVNAGYSFLMDGSSSTNRMALLQNDAEFDNWAISGGAALTGNTSSDDWNIWTAHFNGTSSQFWHNSVSEATGNAGTGSPAGIKIGTFYGANNFFWAGESAEIIIYNSHLSAADINQVGRYLATKYSLGWSAENFPEN